ncbi:peptidylprolyl isomerase [Sphingomonas sp. MMS24-JH45]
MIAALVLAAAASQVSPAPHEPVAADWRAIPNDELLVLRLAGDRTVVIRLAPALAPLHVANIRRLAKAGWWDASSVYRVQEYGSRNGATRRRRSRCRRASRSPCRPSSEIAAFAPAARMARADTHSAGSGITADGWPVASDGQGKAWLTHCYGMVGVARDADPTSGTGAELFRPIGQSARRLDRNYAVVGRIVEGMKWLSALPRRRCAAWRLCDRGRAVADPPPRWRATSPGAAPTVPVSRRGRSALRGGGTAAREPARADDRIGRGDCCEMPLETRRVP